MKSKLIRWAVWTVILSFLLFMVSILALSIGTGGIFFKKIIFLIFNGEGSPEYSILFDIRLPRVMLGLAIGGALGLSGVILQGLFRNPLVEPYTLGVSAGAALGVCLDIVFKLEQNLGILSLPFSGFLGAVLIILILYSLSIKKGILRIQGLLLIGVMLSFIVSSLIMLIMAVSRIEDLYGIVFWVMGSLKETNFFLIKLALGVSILGLVASYFFCHALNAISLGEEEALNLGINVERTKRLLFILTSLLTGFSVSVGGIIGFVGLLVPHFVRLLLGNDYRILLVGCFLTGAIFMILCDTLARVIISPLELPVGVITGILGASIFIYTFTKKSHLH